MATMKAIMLELLNEVIEGCDSPKTSLIEISSLTPIMVRGKIRLNEPSHWFAFDQILPAGQIIHFVYHNVNGYTWTLPETDLI